MIGFGEDNDANFDMMSAFYITDIRVDRKGANIWIKLTSPPQSARRAA
jgi:hypothetical protein